jgi:hypothetical protein
VGIHCPSQGTKSHIFPLVYSKQGAFSNVNNQTVCPSRHLWPLSGFHSASSYYLVQGTQGEGQGVSGWRLAALFPGGERLGLHK